MPSFAVVLAAAGKSSRFSSRQSAPETKKPFVNLAGKPVWQHSLGVFLGREDVQQVIVVIAPEDEAWFGQQFSDLIENEKLSVVAGGAERFDSVANALAAVSEDIEFVAIHDAARPCIDPIMVERVFATAVSSGNAVPAIPISSTVKKSADGVTVDQTVDRSQLYLSQTPQVFATDQLKDAFANKADLQPTDEAQLLELLGLPVYLAQGCALNRKMTNQADVEFCEAALVMLQKKYNSGSIQADPGKRLA